MKTMSSSLDTTAPGQSRQHKHGFGFWAGRILRGLLALLIGVILIGASSQAIATAIDRQHYPAPGQLIDVGGYQLHIHCVGQGSPTVILESGLANMSADWANVQPLVAERTRVCAYDRAGIGWSDPGPQPRDPRQIAGELHTLLGRAGIAGPYVLVG